MKFGLSTVNFVVILYAIKAFGYKTQFKRTFYFLNIGPIFVASAFFSSESVFFKKKINLISYPELKTSQPILPYYGYFSMDEWIGKKSVLVPDIYGTINPDIFHVYVPQSSFVTKYSKVAW